jgi:hypothetical protein
MAIIGIAMVTLAIIGTPSSGSTTPSSNPGGPVSLSTSSTSSEGSSTTYSTSSSTSASLSSTSSSTASSTTTTSSSIQQSATCIILGQPGGIFLRMISDSNQTPIGGAHVTATNEPAYCGSATSSSAATNPATVTFTTNSTEWYSLDSKNNAGYTFTVTYLGQTYTLEASLRPVSVTCATLFIPSGRTSVTIDEFQTNCNPTTTTTTSTSPSQQQGSLTWYANYGVWNYAVTLSTNVIQQGQNITALFTLTNLSNRNQTVDVDGPLVLPTIYAQNGNVAWAWTPPSFNEIENITAGQTISEPLTLPTWMLEAGGSYTLSTSPGISVPGSAVDIDQQLQLNETITVV